MSHTRTIAVIGLGYVGLPVAISFARQGTPVIGFDTDPARIKELKACEDRTAQFEAHLLAQETLRYTTDEAALVDADFFIVTVPTPVDAARRPDLSALFKASRTVGKALKPGDIVVFESTVYPGAVEEDLLPLLEASSHLTAGVDFAIGYSPERINPGDKDHSLGTIPKVISAQNSAALDVIAEVYGSVVTAGLHRAPSIRVAEAAKVIENAQRDLNIALMNELSAIFERLGIDTSDVLAAARTKWNFCAFYPGLVGGHCVGVDPYYLTYRAEKAGYYPEILLAGRRINDSQPTRIAGECVRLLFKSQKVNASVVVTVLGITFKENVRDARNSRVVDLVRELGAYDMEIQVHDPCALRDEVEREYGISLVAMQALKPADVVILAVPHDVYVRKSWPLVLSLLKEQKGVVMDVRAVLPRAGQPESVELWRL